MSTAAAPLFTTIEEFRAAAIGQILKPDGSRFTPLEVLTGYLKIMSPTAEITAMASGEKCKPDGARFEVGEVVAGLLGACERAEVDAVADGLKLWERATGANLLTVCNGLPLGLRGLLLRLDEEAGTHRVCKPGAKHPYDLGFWCGSYYGSVAHGDDPSLVSCDGCRATYGPVVLVSQLQAELLPGAMDHGCDYVEMIRRICADRLVVPVSELRAVLVEYHAAAAAGGRSCSAVETISYFLDKEPGAPAVYRGPARLAEHQVKLSEEMIGLLAARAGRGVLAPDEVELVSQHRIRAGGAGAGVALHLVPGGLMGPR